VFQDEETAGAAKARLEKLVNADLTPFFETAFVECASPDLALINLERWLTATSNPKVQLNFLTGAPSLGRLLVGLLGASQPVADALVQNPELASLITDPAQLGHVPTRPEILLEGRALLQSATSYAHKLDRLRYLKQRWKLPIVVNDLAGQWQPEIVWRALSDLADCLIELAAETVWAEYSANKSLTGEYPVMVVAFGKLGGRELNYSSDVDLVYVISDDLPDEVERHVPRYCEMLNRAVADQMGRGALFRVDLRLRPFGGAGPVAPSMRSIETYYRSHAEVWEAQALIRSEPICGQPELWPRWRELVDHTSFPRSLSEFTLENILQTRERIERHSDEQDLKRGPGGIRDVEFLTQILQMLHGHGNSSVRIPATNDALRALAKGHFLDESSSEELVESYTYLRQLEHRCQLVNDQQTHSLPKSPAGRYHVARLMGYATWEALEADLAEHRSRIRELYVEILHVHQSARSPKEVALAATPRDLQESLASWFDRLPDSEEFYRSLAENADSLHRVTRLLRGAPALIPSLSASIEVTEAALSGEIEEPRGISFGPGMNVRGLASTAWLRLVGASVLGVEPPLGEMLSDLCDEILNKMALDCAATFDVVALGSYGVRSLAVDSDLDIILLVEDPAGHDAAEAQAQAFLTTAEGLKREGWRHPIDLRLRPEGGKGLLVRTYAGLEAYELEAMEIWERFALGQARLIRGNERALRTVLKAAYALPLTPERLNEMVSMKHRIETERVRPQHWKRDVKLGYGGLSDIDWFIHLHEMRYPTTLEVGQHTTIAERLRRMLHSGLINTVEYEELSQARQYLAQVRTRLALLGLKPDVIPENPDKLQKLAEAMGYESEYTFLRHHERTIDTVRAVYLEGLDRLGV
jgi:glutamate-ammonia-ligase adenylyltransferase